MFDKRKPMGPPMHTDDFASGQGMGQDEAEGGPDDTDAMLEELDKAQGAGDEFAAKEFFKTPEGVESSPDAAAASGGDPQLTPELLAQLLELLKQKQAAPSGGDSMPPPMPG